MRQKTFISLILILLFWNCSQEEQNKQNLGFEQNTAKGNLFIIGGGKRPPELIRNLIRISGIDKSGYTIILPMSGGEPDSASYYSTLQFTNQGIIDIHTFNFQKNDIIQTWIDSLENATLIYIPGGDQNRFMEIVLNTPIYDAIHKAFRNGATIAGTSAGAAVMGHKMITGNEYKHPEYTGEYRTIEAENIEIKQGLGLLSNAIVDQHFVKRMRMNRLMSTAIENPERTSIGIDESTAIHVHGDSATVYGDYQVVVLKNPKFSKKIQNGLLGSENMNLSVYLPGDTFRIE